MSVLVENAAPPNFRKAIVELDKKMIDRPGIMMGNSPEYAALCPLKHTFVDGAYVRELFMPKGMVFSTRVHRITHAYFLLKGDVSVLTEQGIVRLRAPLSGVTLAGTKRLIYTHEDTIWVTVHVTKETDLKKIEEEVTAENFDSLDGVIDVEAQKIEIDQFIGRVLE